MTERIGVITPPANATVEMELHRERPHDVDVFVARFPATSGHGSWTGLRERLLGFDRHLEATAAQLADLDLAGVYVACTALSYLSEVNHDFAARLGGRCGKVVTAAGVISRHLRESGAEGIALVSPYPEWLTELSVAHWRAQGWRVTKVVSVVPPGRIYDLDGGAVLQGIRQVTGCADVVVCTGTGMPTLEAIEAARQEDAALRVVSANWLIARGWTAVLHHPTTPPVFHDGAVTTHDRSGHEPLSSPGAEGSGGTTRGTS